MSRLREIASKLRKAPARGWSKKAESTRAVNQIVALSMKLTRRDRRLVIAVIATLESVEDV